MDGIRSRCFAALGTLPATGGTTAITPAGSPRRHESDAVVDLDDLAGLYRARAGSRVPLRQHQLGLAERAMRKQVAQALLRHQLPLLVAELLEAAADDLTPPAPVGDVAGPRDLTEAERLAGDDLRVVEATETCKAALDALQLDTLARLHAHIEGGEKHRFAALGQPRPPGWVDPERLTVMEVSTATGLGEAEVTRRLRLGTARTAAAADLRDRMRTGGLGLHRACTIHTETTTLLPDLTDDQALAITAAALRPKDGAPPSPTLVRQRLTRLCTAADHEAAAKRRQARRRRGAFARMDPDGLATMTVVNDADKIIAAMERADALARAARHAGDDRPLDTLRADIITDLVTTGWPTADAPRPDAGPAPSQPTPTHQTPTDSTTRTTTEEHDSPPTSGQTSPTSGQASPTSGQTKATPWWHRAGTHPPATVWIVVPLTTALGLTDAPCEIPGHGWVTAEHARQLMLTDHSTWQQLTVDPDTGAALHLQTKAYQPTPAMRAHLAAVDGTCRAPGCTVPAARCDLDHDIPWPTGPTSTDNLTHKDRRHHNLHTHEHWDVRRDGDTLHWTTQAGRRYSTDPKDWLEALRDHPATTAADVAAPSGQQETWPQLEAPPF